MKVNVEHFMNFESFFKCSLKKTLMCFDETGSRGDSTGKEDPELPLLQRISSELPASEIAAQTNALQSLSNRHISPSTVERRLRESGLCGQIAAKKPLLKDTNNKRLVWAKKHKQWTLDWWKSVIWSDESFEIFHSNRRVFVRRRVGERMISACVVPTVKHGGGGVMVLCW
jgi:hypothetical protein